MFMAGATRLPFEREIYEWEERIALLEASVGDKVGGNDEIRRMRRELVSLKRKIFSNLKPWETILVARHPERPQMMDYVDLMFEEFVELHGDRAIGDDRA